MRLTDRLGQRGARVRLAVLIGQQAGEADRRTKLPNHGAMGVCHHEGAAQAGFSLDQVRPRTRHEQFAPDAQQVRQQEAGSVLLHLAERSVDRRLGRPNLPESRLAHADRAAESCRVQLEPVLMKSRQGALQGGGA
jgi:hypothetical protein